MVQKVEVFQDLSNYYVQYYICWCSGDATSQEINSHGNDSYPAWYNPLKHTVIISHNQYRR